ncbi:hypothetical protein [Streptosporangium sp. NPDC048865]|uniref:hypothetical protein n=1 Tax=Streptosporangium sp. NPDC048865 TaxID=3155766 RepID=UPI00342C145E
MPWIERRTDTVATDISEIKDHLRAIERSADSIGRNIDVIRDDVDELKAGQVEIRDLLARVVARLEGVAS